MIIFFFLNDGHDVTKKKEKKRQLREVHCLRALQSRYMNVSRVSGYDKHLWRFGGNTSLLHCGGLVVILLSCIVEV